jgi:SAM-dependent methyltransferase
MSDPMMKQHADRDAMGHMLDDYDQHPSSDICEIIEREDGYIEASSPASVYFRPYAEWRPYEQEAMGCVPPGRVLDLGCGAGRVALHFQEQGRAAVGIDISPLAVEVCRRRGLQEGHVLPVTRVGPGLGIFDTIVMAGNNWGLVANVRRARWLLRRFRTITSPNAVIIAESNDIYGSVFPPHLAYQAWNRARGRMSGQIRMRVRYQGYASRWFDYLMVSKPELEGILTGTGWQVCQYFSGEGLSMYAAVLEKE